MAPRQSKRGSMSLLSMFSRKKGPDPESEPASSGFVRPVPASPAPQRRPNVDATAAPSRRAERAARRELLFTVVRECMNRAGVLSASYKFKVLSLDARGSQFLVMVELAGAQMQSVERLAEIEEMVTQAAMAQHGTAVKAVYWRQNDHVTGTPIKAPEAPKAIAGAAMQKPVAAAPQPGPVGDHGYEPIDAEEVAAFRHALASGVKPPREPRAAAAQSYTLLTGFEETEIREDRPADLLSGSQYGDLR
jgi:hypothetical protein